MFHDPDDEAWRGAVLFDLDGTLIDSVYQHVLAWRDALAAESIDLPVGGFTGYGAKNSSERARFVCTKTLLTSWITWKR